MLFKNVIGQEEIKSHLIDMVSQNRLSHALLFLGKEGSGSLSLALAFAQYLVCNVANPPLQLQIAQSDLFSIPEEITGPEASGPVSIIRDACGICAACIKAERFIHPDIHFSFPVITKKAGTPPISDDYIREWREFIGQSSYGNIYDWLQFLSAENKQGNITARECNEINHKLSLKSFESNTKILIMWMPEHLGNSGNKLLKLIEEPPPDTLFLFVAEEEQAILPTILSRTQLIKIPRLTVMDVENALVRKEDTNPDRATQVAALSEGNYREALHLLRHADEDWQGLIRDWLNAIMKNNAAGQVKWIEVISRLGREKQKQFLKYFIHLLQQAIRLQFLQISAGDMMMPENERDFAERLNKMSGVSAQEAIVGELDKASYYVERNANPKMLFHALSIRLRYIIKDNSLILIK
ncbi:MAG: hypothetical protein ABIR19_00630 [Ginsengibacter sp.]